MQPVDDTQILILGQACLRLP